MGPTGVGKTAIAVDVCRAVGGEIVSVDSGQVYRGLEVATNAPGAAELGGIRCHMVGIVEPGEKMNASIFAALARPLLAGLEAAGTVAVLTAGTGLYLKALLDGLDLGLPSDPRLRHGLEAEAARDLGALVRTLEELDPARAAAIDHRNPVRVVRAVELLLLAEERKEGQHPPQVIRAVKVGLTAPRNVLHQWIEARLDRMLAGGMVEEVRRVMAALADAKVPVLRGIGVAEVVAHLRGEYSLDEMRQVILRATRGYAKRQMTWFRADPAVTWIDVTLVQPSDIVEFICRKLRR